jgi:hypothetical protein
VRQHRAQEFRRDLETMMGLELDVTARADMVRGWPVGLLLRN